MNFKWQNAKTLLLTLGIFTLAACTGKEEYTTRSGLKVQIVEKGKEGSKAFENGVATVNLRYETEDGRELMNTATRGGAIPLKTTRQDRGLFDEVIDVLNVGDSVHFEIPAENLFEKTYGLPLPDSIKRGSKLKFYLGFENTYSMVAYEAIMAEKGYKIDNDDHAGHGHAEGEHEQEFVIPEDTLTDEEKAAQLAQWKKEEREQFEKQVRAIDARLEKNKEDNAVKLKNGIRYVIHKEGKGEKPQQGDLLKVYYTGRFFTSNEVFDEHPKDQAPFSFRLGRDVIDGWGLAFAELTEGTKATLYIPSKFAYGPAGYRTIPPFSALVFDVTLVEIEKIQQ